MGRQSTSTAGASPYGELIESLSADVSMAISETKTIHTLTPTDNATTTYRIFWWAVPSTNNGTVGGICYEEKVITIRKASGTVSNIITTNVVQSRNTPLGAATGDIQASGGSVNVRFTTSAGAALLKQCDVYEKVSV